MNDHNQDVDDLAYTTREIRRNKEIAPLINTAESPNIHIAFTQNSTWTNDLNSRKKRTVVTTIKHFFANLSAR